MRNWFGAYFEIWKPPGSMKSIRRCFDLFDDG